jgi:hypothetical protein
MHDVGDVCAAEAVYACPDEVEDGMLVVVESESVELVFFFAEF